jgi:hypothetical protein
MRFNPLRTVAALALVGSIGTAEGMAGAISGSLFEGERTYEYFWLTAGSLHVIDGRCDLDCRDLDLRLFSPDGVEIDNDLLSDDVPVVSVRPARSGRYRVEVIMAHCALEPCSYQLTRTWQ